jgi:DNA-directed RNA polymerase specialized sigma24 family protein
MRQFLDQLDDEWMALSQSRTARRALMAWAADPALEGFPDLDAMVGMIQRRGRPADSDRILLALLRRARSDNLAARTVLEALMPGLKALMATYQLSGTPEDVATAVIEAAFERIRRYPCDRRPARVAANLLNDTRQILWRDGCRERSLRIASEPLTDRMHERLADRHDETSSTDELVDLVCHAVRDARLPPEGARLILLTRVLDVPVQELAGETGGKPQTIRKRRRKAEALLTAAVA